MVKIHNKVSRYLAVIVRLIMAWHTGMIFYWFTMDHIHWFRYSGKPDQNQEYQHFHPVISINYHYMFMLLAYPVAMSEAMMVPRTYHVMYGLSEKNTRNAQTGWQVWGWILLISGIIFIHEQKEANEDSYLYSPHGWDGVFTVGLSFVWVMWGIMLWTLGITNRFARRSLPWFNMWALMTYTVAMHQLGMGINQQHLYMACDNNYCKENMFLDIIGIQTQVIYVIVIFIACSEDREFVDHDKIRAERQAAKEAAKPVPSSAEIETLISA